MSYAFVTARLAFRPLTASDIERLRFLHLHEASQRPDVAGWARWLASVRRLHPCEGEGWAIYEKATQELVGFCAFGGLDARSGQAVLAFGLEASARGKGVAREALASFFDFAFSSPQIQSLRAEVDLRNLASLSVLKALGFSVQGQTGGKSILALDCGPWLLSPLSSLSISQPQLADQPR